MLKRLHVHRKFITYMLKVTWMLIGLEIILTKDQPQTTLVSLEGLVSHGEVKSKKQKSVTIKCIKC